MVVTVNRCTDLCSSWTWPLCPHWWQWCANWMLSNSHMWQVGVHWMVFGAQAGYKPIVSTACCGWMHSDGPWIILSQFCCDSTHWKGNVQTPWLWCLVSGIQAHKDKSQLRVRHLILCYEANPPKLDLYLSLMSNPDLYFMIICCETHRPLNEIHPEHADLVIYSGLFGLEQLWNVFKEQGKEQCVAAVMPLETQI